MVVGFVETRCVVGFIERKFVVVHVPISTHILTKVAFVF